MTVTQPGDEIGELVPFPHASSAPATPAEPFPAASAGAVEPAGPVVDAELLTDEQYQRAKARRLAEFAVARLPARWQDRDHLIRVRAELVRRVMRAPWRYPAAVARGSATAVRAWWAWISVQDFYDAAKQAQQLAQKFQEIQTYRVRRRWWTLGTLTAGGAGLAVAEVIEGPVVVWCSAGVLSAVLAITGRRPGGTECAAVIRPRSIAWAMDGNNLVTTFRDAKRQGRGPGVRPPPQAGRRRLGCGG